MLRTTQKDFLHRPARRRVSAGLLRFLQNIVCVGLIAGLGYGFYSFLRDSPEFRVQQVYVDGVDMLQRETIVEKSGLTGEDCIFFVNPKAVRDRLLDLPYLSECSVTRIFPDTVGITVHERVALATLLVNNRMFEMDQDCNVLRELQPGEKHIDPLITGVNDTGPVEVGQQLTQRPLKAAIGVWRAFCRTDVKRSLTVSEISAAQENRLCMYCDELKGEIRWARGDFDKQAWKLNWLWQNQRNQFSCKEYIDLRFGDDIACK